MAKTAKTFTLNTGAKIPAIGLGTWQSKPDEVSKAVQYALEIGYRHIDTAHAYGNEKEVGDGIKASGVPREQIFLTTKLDNPWHKRVAEGIETSLRHLQTDYVDLYLVHWPCSTDPSDSTKHYPDWDFIQTWAEMQKLPGTGKVRAIGVSNFSVANLQRLLGAASTQTVPAVNQIELHPAWRTPRLVAYCAAKGIHCTGYSCLGSTDSPLSRNETLSAVARKHDRSVAQVMLAWGMQKGWSVIPKSVTPERIRANFESVELVLKPDELAQLDAITDRFKVCGDAWLPIRVFDAKDEEPAEAAPAE